MQNFTLQKTNTPQINATAGFFSKKLKAVKRLSLAALILMLGVNGVWGQVTIASCGFETSGDTWSYTNTGGSASTTNTGTPSNQRIRSGSQSYQFSNEAGVLTFGDITTTGYSSVSIVVRISSISGNATNGADATDFVRLFTKLNSGSFASNTQANADIAVNGNQNARWGYNASGTSTTSGTNVVVAGTGNASGGATDAGTIYSTLTINIPNGTNTVGLRINTLNDGANEIWCIDDVTITGTSSCTAPTTQTTSLSASSITNVGANYAFTRGNGTGGAIVVARATATAAVAPTSGTTYTPSTTGSFTGTTTTGTGNIVIYNGTAAGINAVTSGLNITNLAAGTQYTLTAYEYNTTSTCYNTTSAASASFYTLCDAPTTNAATLVGSSSMTLNWGSVTGASSYRLDVSTASDFSSFVSGFNNLSVAGTSQSVTGLNPSQTYYYRVRAINAASAASANSAAASQATIAAATQFFLVGVPGTGSSGSPLAPFTVEARNGSNVLDVSFTGNISIAQVSGSGTISGNGATAATAGVASFTITFTGADTYTINAPGSLTTSATSGDIVVSLANATSILWSSAGGSAWLTGSNWTGGAVPTSTQVAQFAGNPTGNAGVGINFANTTNAGVQVNGQRIQDVGAIEMTSARSATSSVGNSSGTAGATGTLNLTGVTVNGVSNTILRNNSALSFFIENTQGSGNQTMALSLGNATANVVNINAAGNITVSSPITGTSRNLTINCTSSGDLRVSGTNTYTGGTTVSGGTAGGRLRVDAVSALPTTGDIAVNTGGRITLNIAGTYGGVAQSLTFNPNQALNPSLDILSGAAVTWQGTVALSATTRIEANGATGSLTLSGNVSGGGLLVKQGAGNLVLSGTGNNLTGNTSIGNGTLTINAGSGMGTGGLIMFQTGTNNTALTLNENQTVISLQSSFGATSGTQTHAITIATGKTLTVNQTGNTTYGSGAEPTLTSTIAGAGGLTKSGPGTLTLASANTYTGATTISGGTLALGIANALSGTTAVTLNLGRLSTTGAFNQSAGTLNLNNAASISLFNGNHNVNFAASNAVPWNGTSLVINGWQGAAGLPGTGGKLFVGSNATGLTPEQLAKIAFTGYCTGAVQLANGEVVPKAVLPTAFLSTTSNITADINRIFDPANNCSALTAILPSGMDEVAGNVTTQVWVEATQMTNAQGRPFAKRHYEITPANNAANATGTITLYFSQSEFDDFNDFNPSGPDMPTGPLDGLGISNLRIYKYAGSSIPNDGLPASYAGTGTLIDPADGNIVWNVANSRWEVTFDVVGFSGFFVTNQNFTILPLSAMVLEARQQNGQALLNWTSAKAETATYELQRSSNGQQFTTLHSVAGNGVDTRFTHNDATPATATAYYRVVATDRNGNKRISNVAMLKGNSNSAAIVGVYPNPVAVSTSSIQLTVSNNRILAVRLLSATGAILHQQSGLSLTGSSNFQLPQALAKGVYVLQFETTNGRQVQRLVVQ